MAKKIDSGQAAEVIGIGDRQLQSGQSRHEGFGYEWLRLRRLESYANLHTSEAKLCDLLDRYEPITFAEFLRRFCGPAAPEPAAVGHAVQPAGPLATEECARP